MQVAAAVQLPIHHLRQLAAGQAVADGDLVAAHKADDLRPHNAALHPVPQGIGPVQHHQALPGGGTVLNAVAQGGQKGVVPAAHVCNVVDQGVKKGQGLPGQPLGVLGVKAADGQAAALVDFIGKQGPGGLVPPDTVLRGQQKLQIAALLQHVYCGHVSAGAAGGAGEQGHPPGEQVFKFRNAVSSE